MWRWRQIPSRRYGVLTVCAVIALGMVISRLSAGVAGGAEVTTTVYVHLPLVMRQPTSTETAPATTTPTMTATATATATSTATATVTATATATPCVCSGDLYNCPDFATQAQAQRCYDHCWSLGMGDVHHLDADGDAVACEGLP